jgi:hypothetical protein
MIVSVVEELPSLESFSSPDDAAGGPEGRSASPEDAEGGEADNGHAGPDGHTASPEGHGDETEEVAAASPQSQGAGDTEVRAAVLAEGLRAGEGEPFSSDHGESPVSGVS